MSALHRITVLHKKLMEVLNRHEFAVISISKQGNEYYVEMERFTPAGEDWIPTIWFDGTWNDFIDSVKRAYNEFDVDEEAEIWIESRGERGVPSSIRVLVEDAEWKEKALLELSEELGRMYSDNDKRRAVCKA